MPFAASFWFIDLPWWAFWSLVAVVVLVGGFVLWFLWDEWGTWRLTRGVNGPDDEDMPSKIVYPYYVESGSLRDLAHTVKLDLPTGKHITKSKKFGFNIKGTGGESGDSETEEYGGQLPLLELAERVEESGMYGGDSPARRVADAASVSDEGALSAAIEQIQQDFPTTSQTAELLSHVQDAFSGERVEALAAKKREEFENIAKRNQLLVFKGQFAFKEVGRDGCGPTLKLTHFNPTPGYISPRGANNEDDLRADLIPLPEGVGLDVTLPDGKALTPAGGERILRGEPLYAGLIAHSPSFNSETGRLTCSAWAIWGENTPDWNELAHYRYGGRGGPYGPAMGAQPGYGC